MNRFDRLSGIHPRTLVGWLPAFIAVVAVLVFAIVLHTLQSDTGLSDRQAIGLALGQGVALVVAIRGPHVAWVLSMVAVVLASLWVDGGVWVDAMLNSYLIVLGVIALRVSARAAAGYWCATMAVGSTLALVLRPAGWVSSLVEVAALAGLVLLAGAALRGLVATRHTLRLQRDAAERERERAALLEERTRIARELHDVVAHHMSVIAIQAEAAQYREPDTVPATLAAIRSSAVTALGEMRRILDVLRTGETGVAPQPGLTDIEALVESVRATGIRIDLDLDRVGNLPDSVGLTVYRLVQEALSNAVRHAPGAPVRIRITEEGNDISLTVDNPHHAEALTTDGHGLTGMRERTTTLGGTFTAGPTADGHYRVTATLPITAAR